MTNRDRARAKLAGRASRTLCAGWKTVNWILLGLAIIGLTVIAGAGLLLVVLASSLNSDKDLADFESQAEARDFASTSSSSSESASERAATGAALEMACNTR